MTWRRRVEVETADRAVIVAMAQHRPRVGAVPLAKPLPRGPFVVLAQDLVVDVFEELELDRLAEPLGRLEAVEDDPAGTACEVLIEKPGRAAEDPRQVGLPFVPLVGLEVRLG